MGDFPANYDWFSEGTQEWMVNTTRNPSVAMEHHLHREKTCLGIPSLSTCSFQTKNKLVLCHYWFDYSKTMIRLVIYMPLLRLSIINIHKIINHKYTYHYVYMYHGPIRAPDSPREAPPRGLCGTPGTGRSATGASLRLWPQQRPGGSQTCGAVNGYHGD